MSLITNIHKLYSYLEEDRLGVTRVADVLPMLQLCPKYDIHRLGTSTPAPPRTSPNQRGTLKHV